MSMGPRRKKFRQRSKMETSLPPCLITVLIDSPDGIKESTYPEDRWMTAQILYLAESVKFRQSNYLSLSLILRMGSDTVVLDEVNRK